jgi:hypothetical protein
MRWIRATIFENPDGSYNITGMTLDYSRAFSANGTLPQG